jgi:hypothetical protein
MERHLVRSKKEAEELLSMLPAARVGSGYTFAEAWGFKISSQMYFYNCPYNPKIWVWETKPT